MYIKVFLMYRRNVYCVWKNVHCHKKNHHVCEFFDYVFKEVFENFYLKKQCTSFI